MQSLDSLLAEYEKSHQNPVNKKIHYVCVPAIMFSIIGLFLNIPYLAISSIALAGFYYFKLDRNLSWMMILIMLIMLLVNKFLSAHVDILWLSVGIFVVSWVFQFIGHKIEGKKPSFFNDLLFLLIGPVWILKKLLKV